MVVGAAAGAVAGAAIGGEIFGGFAPFPNSIMIPFMGAQSAVLGYQFGLNYEAGKRTVKSMDNEDFNKFIKSGDLVEYQGHKMPLLSSLAIIQWKEQITAFRNMLPDAQSLMNDIIQQSVEIEKKKAERTPSAWAEIMEVFARATNAEVLSRIDGLTETERNFIFTVAPIVGVMYVFQKKGVTGVIDEVFPETTPGVVSPDIDPTGGTPTPTPSVPELEGVFVHLFVSYGKHSDTNWNWFDNRPAITITIEYSSEEHIKSTLASERKSLLEPLPVFTAARKNIITWNIWTLSTAYHDRSGIWL